MEYLDPVTNEKYIPTIIEYSIGADRLTLAILCEAYKEEELEDGTIREVLSLNPVLAPYKVAILPLVKKIHGEKSEEIYQKLSKLFMCNYDDAGSIGKRYRRNDIIGTPYCITVDDETLNNNIVTIRDRDTMEQISINIEDIEKFIEEKIMF